MKNYYGSISGRAIKPIGLRVVSELREAGIRVPIIATAGIRDFDDCREYFWAGADAVSVGSAVWLAPLPGYLLGPARGARLRRLISRIERLQPPHRAPSEAPPAPIAPHGAERESLAREVAAVAVLRGSFRLRSGVVAPYYIDKYQFGTRPRLLRRLAEALAAELPPDTQCVAGTALGAVPLAIAVSLASGLPAVLVRPDPKDHGPSGAIEGTLEPGSRVVLIEDVVTTGGAALSALASLRDAGAEVTSVLAVVDREEGGSTRLSSAVPAYRPLFTSRDLGIDDAEALIQPGVDAER
jgi:orotate phosphoribosyltransferase